MTSARTTALRTSVALAVSAVLILLGLGTGSAEADAAGRAIKIAAPADDQLVPGSSVRVRVRVAPGARRFRAALDGKDVTSRFRAGGGYRTARLRTLLPGRNHLSVRVRVRGRTRQAHRRFLRLSERRRLIIPLDDGVGLLRHAADPGVHPERFRTDPDAAVEVRLNGRRVRPGRPGRRSTWEVLLNGRDGLRHGDNALQITAYEADGRYDTRRSHFTVAADAPLAAAGADRITRVRRRVQLDAGRRTLPGHPAGRLSYRWRVVEQPRGTAARVTQPRRPNASFRVRRPGTYHLAATVTERRPDGTTRRSTDLLAVTAAPTMPAAGLRVDTMAPDPTGQQSGDGLLLDGRFGSGASAVGRPNWYRHADLMGSAKAVAYAFDPTSLAPIAQAALPGDVTGALAGFLKPLAQGSLIFVIGRDGCCAGSRILPSSGAFSRIFAYDGHGTDNVASAGTVNPGLELGDGIGKPGPAGGLTGYLRPESRVSTTLRYRFMQPDAAGYSTSAPDRYAMSPLDGATVRLISQSDQGFVLDGDRLAPRTQAPSQQWQFRRVYGDAFMLRNASTGQCLVAVPQVHVDACGDGDTEQLWMPEFRVSDKTYRLRSVADPSLDQVLTAAAGDGLELSTSDGTDARWALGLAPGVYTVADARTGAVIAEPDSDAQSGAALVAREGTGAPTEQWRVVDGREGGMRFVNVASGLCLDVRGGGQDESEPVERWQCVREAGNQSWLAGVDDDGLSLTSLQSGKVLARDGTALVQHSDAGATSRRWILRRMPEPAAGGSYVLATTTATPGSDDPIAARAVETGAGNDVHLGAALVGGAPQQWTLEQLEMAGVYRLRNMQTGRCMNHDGNDNNAKQGDCWTMNESYDSSWRLRPQGDGTVALETVEVAGVPARVVGLEGQTGLRLVPPDGSASQRFTFAGRPVTFAVGRERYSTSLPAGVGGFAVHAFDAALRPLAGYPQVVVTNGGTDPKGAARLAAQLKDLGARQGVTVLLQSVGRPRPTNGDWSDVADAIGKLGGDARPIVNLDGTGDYAFAGCGRGCARAPAFIEAVRRQADRNVVGARLNGALSRTGTSGFGPDSGSAVGIDSSMRSLAARGPSPWPYAGTQADVDVLQAVHDYFKLGSRPSCPGSTDPVRGHYCVTLDPPPWGTMAITLSTLPASRLGDSSIDAARFEQVIRPQLVDEWEAVAGVAQLVGNAREAIDYAAEPDTGASSVAQTIYDSMGRPVQRRDVTGGVWDTIKDSLSLLQAVGPALLADAPPPAAGTGGEGVDFPSANDAALGLIGDIFELVGGADDGSSGVSLESIRTTATGYAQELDDQLKEIRDNLPGLQNILVSDPDRLILAAANARWDVGDDQDTIEAQLKAGTKQTLWKKVLPAAFQLWQYPAPPSRFSIRNLWCSDSGNIGAAPDGGLPQGKAHWVYQDQPDGVVYANSVTVDGNGNRTGGYMQTLTPFGADDILTNYDRDVRQPLIDALYGDAGNARAVNAGLQPPDVPFAIDFDVVTWPAMRKESSTACGFVNGKDNWPLR